jgi:hypothetical protein
MSIFQLSIEGIERLNARLAEMTPTIRRRFARKALLKGAEVVRKVAASPGVVPVLGNPIYRRGVLIRKPGAVRDAIKTRTSKDTAKTGDVGVFVNVAPARGADRGKNNPNDNYYWRWIHFKTKRNNTPRPFLLVGAAQLEGQALTEIKNSLGVDIQSMNQLKLF